MDRQQIALRLSLRELCIELDMGSFDRRLVVQKAAYLAQAAGVGLGYYFRWYLRGPYSPDLTSDAFSIQDELAANNDEAETWELDPSSRSKLGDLKPLLSSPSEKDRARSLELLASIHYLVSRNQVKGEDSREVQVVLKRNAKDYSLSEIDQALAHLREHDLFSTQQSTPNNR